MKIETKFSNGDEVYSLQKDFQKDSWIVLGPMIIGKVTVEVTDSKGRDGETMFDNFKPQKEAIEKYMCVETGIGTGVVYNSDRVFSNRSGAEALAKSKND